MKVLHYPDKTLKMISNPVSRITNVDEATIVEMFEVMKRQNGIGLSAIQIGYPFRIFIMDTSSMGGKMERRVFFNPEIVEASTEIVPFNEGCLSFPGLFAIVKRPSWVKVKARDDKFEEFELTLDGIDAVCFQHELDHLNGITFYDHLSPVKKDWIKKKMKKLGLA